MASNKMSGAAARTGDFKEKGKGKYIKIGSRGIVLKQ